MVIDGKYIAVKGFKKKIPFIYGIDYLTHDIPHGDLYTVEDERAFSIFFQALKDIGYEVKIVIADDRNGIKQALFKVFPFAKLQLCHGHFLENIRKALNTRTDDTYQHFFNSLKKHVFTDPKNDSEVSEGLRHVSEKHAQGNKLLKSILLLINDRRKELYAYLQIPNAPNNTNLIELYNSHLNGRLKTIKGFSGFVSAQLWLNAYLIRRRVKPVTDCDTSFKHLNSFASLQMTIRESKLWPTWISGILPPRKALKR